MKIIDIQLGRKSSYGGTAGEQASPWEAKLKIPSQSGSGYSDERTIPADIAEKMATAAFNALVDSGYFNPTFAPEVVPLPKREEKLESDPPVIGGGEDRVEI